MMHDFVITRNYTIFMDLPVVFDPCYVFHPMNAFERDGSVVIDVGRFRSMWRTGSTEFEDFATLHRWQLDLGTVRVTETPLDDRPAEFARVADDRVGLPNRYGYMVATRPGDGSGLMATQLLKYDLSSGACAVHECGRGRRPGEGVFVADPDRGSAAAEDAGWVVTYVYDDATDTSDLVIIDATDFTAAPDATVSLPRRIPFGFHGSWVPGLG